MKNLKPFSKTLDSARKFKRLFGDSRKKKGLSSGFVTLKRGKSVGLHTTGKKEEIIVVFEGKAQIDIKGKHLILKEKTMLYIPPNTLHDVKNIDARPLKYLYITAPTI